MRVVHIQATTDEDGDASVTQVIRAGEYAYELLGVEWIDGDYADGVDAVLSCVNTRSGVDRTLLTLTDANSDAFHQPLRVAQDALGADLDTAGDVAYARPIVDGDLKLVVSSGGNAKTGGCVVFLKE